MNKLIKRSAISILTIIIMIIFFGAIIHCARQFNEEDPIGKLLFYSALILLFIQQINRGFDCLYVRGRKTVP